MLLIETMGDDAMSVTLRVFKHGLSEFAALRA
jgi:hypothetical protein